jgi:hypothetical protein
VATQRDIRLKEINQAWMDTHHMISKKKKKKVDFIGGIGEKRGVGQ